MVERRIGRARTPPFSTMPPYAVAYEADEVRIDGRDTMRWHRYLIDDESVALELRKHPVVLARPAILFLAVAGLALSAGFLLTPDAGNDIVDGVAAAFVAFMFLRFLWRYLSWRSDLVIVTDRRILRSQGVLTRSIGSVPFGAISDLTCRRPLLGRVLGYGDLVVETAGRSEGVQRIDRLGRPEQIYREVTSLMSAHGRPRGPLLEEGGTGRSRRGDTPAWGDPAALWDEVDDSEAWDVGEHDDTGPLPRVVV
jgi:membrane protein YdbS with pleckstrin-like domain